MPDTIRENTQTPLGRHAASKPVILFDGVCNLCNGVVNFLIDRDPEARLRFGSLQSAEADKLLAELQFDGSGIDSILLIADGRVLVKSAAALAIAKELGGGWTLMRVLWIVPKPLRDFIYDWIARNRYRWFGRRDECRVPTPDLRMRFIDAAS